MHSLSSDLLQARSFDRSSKTTIHLTKKANGLGIFNCPFLHPMWKHNFLTQIKVSVISLILTHIMKIAQKLLLHTMAPFYAFLYFLFLCSHAVSPSNKALRSIKDPTNRNGKKNFSCPNIQAGFRDVPSKQRHTGLLLMLSGALSSLSKLVKCLWPIVGHCSNSAMKLTTWVPVVKTSTWH